jgi:putative transposase
LSILVENVIEPIQKPVNDVIGIDVGIKDFMVCSDGRVYDNLKLRKSNEKQLIKLQRQISKKVIGSKNRYKAKIKLARKHEKINNKKLDYLHNITTSIVRENQTIVIEDLNVKGMLKNHCLAKSISDLSISEAFRQLEYKCKWYGRDLVVIDRWFPSSKLCSVCGHKYSDLSLKERTWKCTKCGTVHDRDANAAQNIKKEGQRIIGTRLPKFALVDNPTMDDRLGNKELKSSGWSKQEELNLTSTCRFC